MKIDMDTVRSILVEIESWPADRDLENFSLEGYDPEVTDYHIRKLAGAGYLLANFVFSDPANAIVTEPTWERHQLLDSIKSPGVWARIKATAAKEGGSIPVELLKPLALHYLKEQLGMGGE